MQYRLSSTMPCQSAFLLAGVLALILFPAARAADGTWSHPSGGSWSDAANWSGGQIAGGAGSLADFSALNLTTDATVQLGGTRTVGVLLTRDLEEPLYGWTMDSGILNMKATAGTPHITVGNGTTTIRGLLAGNQGVEKAGGGTLFLENPSNTFEGELVISEGLVRIGTESVSYALGAVGPGNGTTVSSGAVLDINAARIPDAEVVTLDGGMLVNNGREQYYGLANLTLLRDSAVGGNNRFDMRPMGGPGVLDLGGNTLLKVDSKQFSLIKVDITPGVIDIQNGMITVEVDTTADGDGRIILRENGTLGLWGTNPDAVFRPLRSLGGTIRNVGHNATLDSPIQIEDGFSVTLRADNDSSGDPTVTSLRGGLTGQGSVSKTGPGFMRVEGPLGHLGGTTISEGTLVLTETSDSEGDIAIGTGGTLKLEFTGIKKVGRLYLNANAQEVGTWGALNSGADHETERIIGTGLLNVTKGASGGGGGHGIWINAAGGSWGNDANWEDGEIPEGPGAIADLATLDLADDARVTLDGLRTVGTVLFDDVDLSHSWTLATGSSGSLVLADDGGAPKISVRSGSAIIDAMIGGLAGFHKTGPGTLVLNGNNHYSGELLIMEGSVVLGNDNAAGAAGPGNDINILAGAEMDVNGFKIDNTKRVYLAGALVNNGGSQHDAVPGLTLTGDATVGGENRFDLRPMVWPGLFDMAGHTLTKLGGNQFSIVGVTVTAGNLSIEEGTVSIEAGVTMDENGRIDIGPSGTLGLWDVGAGVVRRPIFANGGVIRNLGWNTILDSPIEMDDLGVTTFRGSGADIVTQLRGVISGGGVLVKTEPGTLVLAANNIYDGELVVLDGTVSITGSVNEDSLITLNGNGKLKLEFSGTNTIYQLFIDDKEMNTGTWGALDSAADHKTDRITGPGMLLVVEGPDLYGDPFYEDWAADHGLQPGEDGLDDDPDHDGMSNLMEFALDGDPLSAAASGKVHFRVVKINGERVLTLTFPVFAGAFFQGDETLISNAVHGLRYGVQAAETPFGPLVSALEVTGAAATAIQAELPALSSTDWSYRTFRPVDSVEQAPRRFMRVLVQAE